MAFKRHFGIPLDVAVKQIGKLKFGDRWNDSDFDNSFSDRRNLDYDAKFRVKCCCSKVYSLIREQLIIARTTTEDDMSVIELSGKSVRDDRFILDFEKSEYLNEFSYQEPIYIAPSSLTSYINSVTKQKPRKERTFAWRHIVLMAVQFTHSARTLPSESEILHYIQELGGDKQATYPHEKDLYLLAEDILKIFDSNRREELSFKITSEKTN